MPCQCTQYNDEESVHSEYCDAMQNDARNFDEDEEQAPPARIYQPSNCLMRGVDIDENASNKFRAI
jgi:hypothetical protein